MHRNVFQVAVQPPTITIALDTARALLLLERIQPRDHQRAGAIENGPEAPESDQDANEKNPILDAF